MRKTAIIFVIFFTVALFAAPIQAEKRVPMTPTVVWEKIIEDVTIKTINGGYKDWARVNLSIEKKGELWFIPAFRFAENPYSLHIGKSSDNSFILEVHEYYAVGGKILDKTEVKTGNILLQKVQELFDLANYATKTIDSERKNSQPTNLFSIFSK